MLESRYEIVEEDTEARDVILSYMMPQHLLEGIAYFCMVESGRPMSPSDMTSFLGMSDSWYTEQFSQAVSRLMERGLVRVVK